VLASVWGSAGGAAGGGCRLPGALLPALRLPIMGRTPPADAPPDARRARHASGLMRSHCSPRALTSCHNSPSASSSSCNATGRRPPPPPCAKDRTLLAGESSSQLPAATAAPSHVTPVTRAVSSRRPRGRGGVEAPARPTARSAAQAGPDRWHDDCQLILPDTRQPQGCPRCLALPCALPLSTQRAGSCFKLPLSLLECSRWLASRLCARTGITPLLIIRGDSQAPGGGSGAGCRRGAAFWQRSGAVSCSICLFCHGSQARASGSAARSIISTSHERPLVVACLPRAHTPSEHYLKEQELILARCEKVGSRRQASGRRCLRRKLGRKS
jgi:hypothetical protein